MAVLTSGYRVMPDPRYEVQNPKLPKVMTEWLQRESRPMSSSLDPPGKVKLIRYLNINSTHSLPLTKPFAEAREHVRVIQMQDYLR